MGFRPRYCRALVRVRRISSADRIDGAVFGILGVFKDLANIGDRSLELGVVLSQYAYYTKLFECGLHGANRLASNSLIEGLVYGTLCARGAVRFSLGASNTAQEVDEFLKALKQIVARFKNLTAMAV